MIAPISSEQIRAIQSMRRRIGLDEADYRDMLEAVTGKRSAKALDQAEAWRVIDKLKPMAPPLAKGAAVLTGQWAGVCRALWIAAYNLGLARERTDKALIAYVKRQTDLAHLNWMRAPGDAAKVIEGLKSWIARETGVTWDADKGALAAANIPLARWRKLEILRAQMRRLETLGDHGPFYSHTELAVTPDAGLDRMSAELGKRLRGAQEARTRAHQRRRKAG